MSDSAKPGHSGEGEWSDELAKRQFLVEVVEFGLSFWAGEYGVKWLTILIDNSGPAPRMWAVFRLGIGAGGPQ